MVEKTNSPQEWRLLAERDLAVAEHLAKNMHPIPTEIVAFHCQQAVEKFLKGALVIYGDDPPYIHDLDKLCSQVEKHHSSFSNISIFCTTINYFSVQPRYDLGISLSEEDMHIVLLHTKQIKEFLQTEIPSFWV